MRDFQGQLCFTNPVIMPLKILIVLAMVNCDLRHGEACREALALGAGQGGPGKPGGSWERSLFQEGKAAKMRCELRRVLGVRLGAGGGERRNKPSAFPRVAAALHRRRPAGRAAGELRNPPRSPEKEPLPKPASPRRSSAPWVRAGLRSPPAPLPEPCLCSRSSLRSDQEALIACKEAIC